MDDLRVQVADKFYKEQGWQGLCRTCNQYSLVTLAHHSLEVGLLCQSCFVYDACQHVGLLITLKESMLYLN